MTVIPTLKQRLYVARYRRLGAYVAPEADPPFSTHLPLLTTLGMLRPIRSVLELGSGPFSTPLFLDRTVYPDLERLVSYEDVPEWEAVVREAAGPDPRLDLRMVPAVSEAVPVGELGDFDLIFIDDSRRLAERARTIKTVGQTRPRAIVVIHDIEWRPYYRAAKRGFDHVLPVVAFTPQVAMCWNGDAMTLLQAHQIAEHIVGTTSRAPTDREAWKEAARAGGLGVKR
jgi:predicted O-methyltransferase YrrM